MKLFRRPRFFKLLCHSIPFDKWMAEIEKDSRNEFHPDTRSGIYYKQFFEMFPLPKWIDYHTRGYSPSEAFQWTTIEFKRRERHTWAYTEKETIIENRLDVLKFFGAFVCGCFLCICIGFMLVAGIEMARSLFR